MTAGPRRFVLQRRDDPSGISGTGDVAEGVQWADGEVVLHWRGQWPTTTVWRHGLEALLAVHGHGGRTTVEWIDGGNR